MYKAAVIGLGKIGLMYDLVPNREHPSSHTMAYELHPNIDMVAGMDIRDQQKTFLQQIAPTAMYYNDMMEMLDCHDVDVVSLCVPPKVRLDMIKKVLECSKARIIFCEKPVLNCIEEIPELRSLLNRHSCLLIPNLSRRWNHGTVAIREMILSERYGSLQSIHVRYTRGIYNTGSHLFDLIRYYAGDFQSVRVVKKVYSSAEQEGEPSFSFIFALKSGVTGYAEAFNDEYYYMFEMDLYFEGGKIEVIQSGDEIRYFEAARHPLFQGFKTLRFKQKEKGLLEESNLKQAVNHIVDLLGDVAQKPICSVEDGIYPLFVADALLRSYSKVGSLEEVAAFYE